MKKLILVSTNDEERYKELNALFLSYCYLHGQAEVDAGYDIMGVAADSLPFTPKEGQTRVEFGELQTGIKYDCDINGKEGTFFLWSMNSSPKTYKGLAVYNDDTKSYADAEAKFNRKEQII